jgi:hypothetical protein
LILDRRVLPDNRRGAKYFPIFARSERELIAVKSGRDPIATAFPTATANTVALCETRCRCYRPADFPAHRPAFERSCKPRSETLVFPDDFPAAERSQRPASARHIACTAALLVVRALDPCQCHHGLLAERGRIRTPDTVARIRTEMRCLKPLSHLSAQANA